MLDVMEKEYNGIREFDEMKAQLSLLKEKLDKQSIVNEQHLRNAIKDKLKELNRYAVRMIVVGLVALAYCTYFLKLYNFSNALIAFTAVMFMVCVLATYIQHRELMRISELSADLVKETLNLIKLKKRYNQWMLFATPLIFIWGASVSYEILYVVPDMSESMAKGMLCGVIIGIAIGGFIGVKVHNRTLKKIKNILAQIDELKSVV
jgi:hypothetical protein